MSHIHFIGGEKGGVGKSLVSRILAQYLIDNDRPFLGFDTDKIARCADAILFGLRLTGGHG